MSVHKGVFPDRKGFMTLKTLKISTDSVFVKAFKQYTKRGNITGCVIENIQQITDYINQLQGMMMIQGPIFHIFKSL